MASLNLVPNPSVLIVQAGIFLANLAIIKKFFVEPYMAVRDRRDALTIGNKDAAQEALQQAEATQQKIAAVLASAAETAKKNRQAAHAVAVEKRNVILASAEREAKTAVAAVEKEIQANLAAEKAKIPAIVAALSQEVYQLALQ